MRRVGSVVEHQLVRRSFERIKAVLRLNGSDIELVQLENSTVKVALKGRVVESFDSVMLLRIGIERALGAEVPGFAFVLTEIPDEESTGN